MLASIFQESGKKTGLYTSPHYIDFRERIKVNGQMIGKSQVVKFVDLHKASWELIKPSFFEITLAMAFDHFCKENVDIAIIETGMGGRLDSTNIITPQLSVITNIGYDHMQMLGNTLQEIAGEKAGIIKRNVPVVIGEWQKETSTIFKEKSKEMRSPVSFASKKFLIEKKNGNQRTKKLKFKSRSEFFNGWIEAGLTGPYQEIGRAHV